MSASPEPGDDRRYGVTTFVRKRLDVTYELPADHARRTVLRHRRTVPT
ncbi:hypothetical protein [Streptomyces sp. TE33382]